MKKMFGKLIAVFTAAMLLTQSAALADTISFSGTVTAGETYEVYAPIGGTVESVDVEVGQQVTAGTVLATLSTTKVYATESGTVTGVFGQVGDNADTVAEKYGAVMYIEGDSVYSIAASTDNAYNKTENKFVHVGEEVVLSCYSDGDHTGTGVITSISGTDYTVKVLSGEFEIGETVNIYRDSESSSNRIGRGTLSRVNPTAVKGSGSIVSYAVSNGDTVERGDLLFETLSGDFDGLYMSGNQILADVDGTVAEINLSQGSKVEKDSVVAVLYPSGKMRVEAHVEEGNLNMISVGDEVSVELIWNQDEEVTYPGTITMISAIADSSTSSSSSSATSMGSSAGSSSASSSSDTVTYTVYIDFDADENTRYGMTAVVNTLEDTVDTETEEEGSEQN